MPNTNLNENNKKMTFRTDLVRTYLHEIGRVPLLTHEEELIYGRQVQKKRQLLAKKAELTQILHREPNLTEWSQSVEIEESELLKTLQQGDRAKRKMIEGNLRLVVAIAKKYQKRNMDFLDLIQEGSLGLEKGVERFDPTRGFKFSTYAYWWIRQAITRAIAQQSRTIRLPIHITEKLNKIKKTQRELSQILGRNPTPKDIAEALDVETSQIRECLSVSRRPMSLDVKVGDNRDTELSELLEDGNESPEKYTIHELMRQDLEVLLGELTPQQREVLSLRFGFVDGKELSLAKIGKIMNLSREKVRQLESQALKQLRQRENYIKGYLEAS